MTSLAQLLKEYAAPADATSGLAGYGSGGRKPLPKGRRIVNLRAWLKKVKAA